MPALKAFSGSFEWNKYLQLENSFTLKFDFSTPNGEVYKGIRVDHYTFSMYYIVSDYVEYLVYQATFLDENARAFETSDRVVLPYEQTYIANQLNKMEGNFFNAYPIILDTRLNNIYITGGEYVFDDSYDVEISLSGYDTIDPNSVEVTVSNALYHFNRNTGVILLNNASADVVVTIKGILKTDIFNVALYNNKSEKNRVNKASFLTLIDTVSGAFRGETTLTDVEIDIEYNIVDNNYGSLLPINYIYIPIFRRFYFVDEIEFVRKNLITLKCSVDVLYTYRAKILELYGFIDRNEFEYNDKIIDTKRVVEQGTDVISFSSTSSELDTLTGAVDAESTNIVINALASDTIPE